MLFREIIGQEEVKERLRQLVREGKMPHALMLSGKQGVGKLPLALALAQYLCCSNRTESDACGTCPSCVKYAKMEHPDLHLVFPIVAEKSRGIQVCDDLVKPFRSAVLANPYLTIESWINGISEGKAGVIYKQESEEIVRKLNLKSYESENKVMLIWLPEKMNDECANKLLKILEEPFDKTFFIMVSDNSEQIIGTIRSRTQSIHVSPIEQEVLKNELQKSGVVDAASLDITLRLAQGSWSRAMELANERDEQHHYFEAFMQMMRAAYGLDVKAIKQFMEQMAGLNREQQKSFLKKAQEMVRENFIARMMQPQLSYMQQEEAGFAQRFSQFIHEKNVEQIMTELAEAEAQIEQNVNGKFVFYHLCLQLYFSLRIAS